MSDSKSTKSYHQYSEEKDHYLDIVKQWSQIKKKT